MFDMLDSFCLGTMYDFEDKIHAPTGEGTQEIIFIILAVIFNSAERVY